MNKYFLIFIVVSAMFLSGCSLIEDPRAMASTKMALTYDGERCQPYESLVPMGEEVEITLINNSEYDFTWYLIFYPLKGRLENQDPDNFLAYASAPAGESNTSTIKAPFLPGKYDSLCVRDNDTENRALTYLLVVEPYSKQTPEP